MDPPFVGKFIFEADGVEIGAFMECTGLSVQVEVQTVVEGGQNHFVHQLPGRMKWPNIVLKRGITDSDQLFEWFWKTSGEGYAGEGKLERTGGRITLLDPTGEPARSWDFEGAIPVKWTGPSLKANANDVATEQLEIAHHGFRPSA
jgi:phage tail-like protein